MLSRLGLQRGRLLQVLLLLFGITVVTFILIRLVPGDPARQILGNHYTPAGAAAVRHSLGLDRPIWTQYGLFIESIFQGTLGHSYYYNTSVGSLLASHVGPTLFLVLAAAVLTALISIPLGVLSAIRRGGAVDQATRLFFTVGFALPGFLLGVFLILIFGVKMNVLPIGGYGNGFVDILYHLILPAITLAVPFSTVLIRSLRASTMSILDADFVTTAKLKGIGYGALLRRHIVRNSIISVVVVFGVNLAFLVGGTVIVENVFSIPGLGRLLVDSVSSRDYPVVQGVTLLFAFFIIVVNLFTDIVHSILDPRISATLAAAR